MAHVEETCKTYSDENFYGKSLPETSSLDLAVGDLKDWKRNGVVSVIYLFNTFYKGGFPLQEELTVMQEKNPDVQMMAVSCDPDKEKVEKLLGKIAAGTCCDPITKQVWRLKVPFVAWDANKTFQKALSDLFGSTVLHTPQAVIVDAQGNIAWRQGLLQTYTFADSAFEKQLTLIKEGKKVAQPFGEKPKVDANAGAEEAECDDMSLF